MKKMLIYTDASAIGGCEDLEFAQQSLALWRQFERGECLLLISEHTLRELIGAPEAVKKWLTTVPDEYRIVITDNKEADELAEAYLAGGIVGPGSRSDALHVALATVAGADVIVSWNFRHIVNLGKIRQFNAANLTSGYRQIEIRTPKEVSINEE